MPGKRQRDRNAKKLTKRQAKIAEDVLLPRFNRSLGERQWDSSAKEQLVQAVNDAFAAKGFETIYSQRKLEDWVSNTMYRGRQRRSRRVGDAAELEGAGEERTWRPSSCRRRRPRRRRRRSSTGGCCLGFGCFVARIRRHIFEAGHPRAAVLAGARGLDGRGAG